MTTSIGQNLVTVIKDKELLTVTADIIETTLDAKLAAGVLKDIPFLSTIFGTYNAITSVQDKLFVKKLYTFLYELKSVSQDKRFEQIIKIEDDSKYQTKVGEKLLYIIDKAEDTDKASLIGRLFKSYLEEKIDYDVFLSCVTCIDRAPLPDLLYFIKSDWDKRDLNTDDGFSHYVSYGLMEIIIIPPNIKVEKDRYSMDDRLDYKITDFKAQAWVSPIGSYIRDILKG